MSFFETYYSGSRLDTRDFNTALPDASISYVDDVMRDALTAYAQIANPYCSTFSGNRRTDDPSITYLKK